nr:hypothetical protein CFP56_34782 [Quercus suber]
MASLEFRLEAVEGGAAVGDAQGQVCDLSAGRYGARIGVLEVASAWQNCAGRQCIHEALDLALQAVHEALAPDVELGLSGILIHMVDVDGELAHQREVAWGHPVKETWFVSGGRDAGREEVAEADGDAGIGDEEDERAGAVDELGAFGVELAANGEEGGVAFVPDDVGGGGLGQGGWRGQVASLDGVEVADMVRERARAAKFGRVREEVAEDVLA